MKALALASRFLASRFVASRFLVVGLLCAVAHNAIMLGADRWHLHYVVSCAISYVLVVLFGFALHVRFTFQETPSFAAFWRYAVSMAANYPFTLALLFLMCDVAGLSVVIAAPVTTVLMMAWNFVASRWAIVRTPASHSPSSSQ
jgi:putative flippase GtrA